MRRDDWILKTLERIKKVLSQRKVRGVVYLFGSSVRDDYRRTSDIDLAIDSPDRGVVTILRSDFEELDIPYKVDLVDLSEVGESLREEILKGGVIIWKN